jgi:HEAT repeat protein
VRNAAATALGRIGDPRAVEPLVAALKHTLVQREAANALIEINAPEAVHAIVTALSDNNWDVRNAVYPLEKLLERNLEKLEEHKLRAVVALDDRVSGIKTTYLLSTCNASSDKVEERIEIDYSRIRQLARQELIGRGLRA